MFDFNINWDSLANFNNPTFLANLEKDIAALTATVATAVVNSPAVVEAPKNIAPAKQEVQKTAIKVVEAVAPVIAPTLPTAVFVKKFVPTIAEEIVASPQVKAADVGKTVDTKVTNTIVQSVLDTAAQDKEVPKLLVAPAPKGDKATPEPTPTPSGAESGTIGAIQTSLGKKPEAPVGDTGGFNPLQPMVPYEPPYFQNKTEKFVAIPYDKLSADVKKVLELNGKSQGMTGEEYYRSRGGVNASGYYGDSYVEGVTLSDAEYKAAVDKATAAGATGVGIGAAINAASAVKAYNADIAAGVDPLEAENKLKRELDNNQGMLDNNAYTGPRPDPTDIVDIPVEIKDVVVPQPGPTGPSGPTGPTGPTGPGLSGPTGPAQTYTAPDGKMFTDLNAYNAYLDQLKTEDKTRQGRSAYDLLYNEFNKYGLGALVQPLETFIKDGLSPAEFTIKLRDTDAYKRRFAANQQRLSKGLRVLSEAEYIGLEDQYQDIMRRYGLPEGYYSRGEMGRQEGFEKLIANDVSNVELEDRIATAQNRILYANPEVGIALKTFYPDISNGDMLAYALDPEKALAQIKRRITAAEIGASAVQMGLATNVTDAEYLARYGVTKEQAQQGYRNVAEVLPRASMLGDIYAKQGMGPYTQATATQEMFNVPGAAEAAAKRRKLTELEQAQFSGRAGLGALARERAGSF